MLPGAGSTVPRPYNLTSVTGCNTVDERPPRDATGKGYGDATGGVAGTNVDVVSQLVWLGWSDDTKVAQVNGHKNQK